MQKLDYNYLVRLIPSHLFKFCGRVEKQFVGENAGLGILGLDVGNKYIGVSLFKRHSNEIEPLTKFDRAKADQELPQLIEKHKVLGMVVNMPKEHHEHVTSFIGQLDGNEIYRGLPFCYFQKTK